MEVEFSDRGVGVRRGRRPKEAPEELLEILRQTYEQRTQANIDIRGFSTAEVAEFARLVKNGAAQLGFRERIFGVRSGRELRFWMEDNE